MAKISYKQVVINHRITNLIGQNYNDDEIQEIIEKEYKINLNLKNIQNKRVSKSLNIKVLKLSLDDKTKIIQKILIDNFEIPLTKKELLLVALDKFKVTITKDEAKDILWDKLRSEINFDRDKYTYKLNDHFSNNKPDIYNEENADELTTLIDGYTIIVKIVKREFEPLYWSKTEGLKQIIYYNKLHPKAQNFKDSSFVQLLVALGRTSLSFSDNSGEIFFNRLKNYLDLT